MIDKYVPFAVFLAESHAHTCVHSSLSVCVPGFAPHAVQPIAEGLQDGIKHGTGVYRYHTPQTQYIHCDRVGSHLPRATVCCQAPERDRHGIGVITFDHRWSPLLALASSRARESVPAFLPERVSQPKSLLEGVEHESHDAAKRQTALPDQHAHVAPELGDIHPRLGKALFDVAGALFPSESRSATKC